MVLHCSAAQTPNTPWPTNAVFRRAISAYGVNSSGSYRGISPFCTPWLGYVLTHLPFCFSHSLCREVLRNYAKVKAWSSLHIQVNSDSNLLYIYIYVYVYTHTHIFCSSQLAALEHGITCLEDMYKQVGSSACFSTHLCHSASALERLQDEKVAQKYYSILYYETYYILWSSFNPRDWNPEISGETYIFPKEKLWDFDIANKDLKILMQDCHRDSEGKHQKS